MPTLAQVMLELKKHKEELSSKYFIKRIGVFGSFARGDASEGSDLDILVELAQPIGLDFISLADELEEILKVKVDLLSDKSIKPSLKKYIDEDLLYV